MTVRVAISGTGKMGRQLLDACGTAADLEVVGVLEKFSEGDRFVLSEGQEVAQSQRVEGLGDFGADVVVDFSHADWAGLVLREAVSTGVRPVIGTSGLPDDLLSEATSACAERSLGGVVAANFALGAVMMMHLARVAAPFFEAVEVIEQHHDGKVDAPSGTAIATAQAMRAARGSDFARNVAERRRCRRPGRRSWVG